MIVRVWSARATPENAPTYREHVRTHVFPVLRSVEGFLGAELLEKAGDDEIEFVVASRWTSLDAVRRFAGDAYENAVVMPAAKAALASFDEQVEHFEVSAECGQ